MDVSVIIVSFNTRDVTRNCLASIFEMTAGVEFEVIVADNGSVDGSPEMVRSQFPQVRLIEMGRNIGFGPANNRALQEASGKYLFFLNSDTRLLNNAAGIFFDRLEETKEPVGVAGAMLEDEEGNRIGSYGRFPSYSGLFRDRAKALVTDPIRTVAFILGENWISLRKERPVEYRRSVDYVEGADLFIPRLVLEEIGSFDERYFLGVEEVDLQYRMERSGYARLIVEGPRIVHLQHKSSPDPSGMKGAFSRTHSYSNQGTMYFLKKHKPSALRPALKALMVVRYLNPVFFGYTVRNRCLAFLLE